MSDYHINPEESDEDIVRKLQLIKQREAEQAAADARERDDLTSIQIHASSPLTSPRERAICREILRLRAEIEQLKRNAGGS
jgi:hypothetical protein